MIGDKLRLLIGLTIQKLLNGVIFPISGKNLKIVKNLIGGFWFRQIKNHDFIRFLVKFLDMRDSGVAFLYVN